MISRKINTCNRYTPVPISFLIHTARAFDCDIYIRCNDKQVNVKSYDEMIRDLSSARTKSLVFFFNGSDELAAQQKIERIFLEQ
ncbi:HPr family phosphocarrier protein [uncultured Ligilactobacillus sp.]|uniref:HPr family phosphocarrier protein n=1 Tax=uncultured Ligilactobacillus sp. TaxID=2837633 RepID=UPI0027295AD0|nr:HPr family phosphocarrier protein [uncultured Ligilactobacillus sp.]